MPDSRRKSVRITESHQSFENSKGRVDRASGTIKGVKVLGQRSSNGRIYLAEAIRQAAHLYENKSVRLDHPDNPDDQRSVDSVIGSLVNVHVGSDGDLYGDLKVIKSHPFAARLFEMAEGPSHLVSLSHNAQGSTREGKDGLLIVDEIVEVRSVDLVCDGATTKSLFESHQPNRPHKFDTPARKPVSSSARTRESKPRMRAHDMPQTLREHFERQPLLAKDRRRIKRLFEAGGPMAGLEDMPMDEDIPMDTGLEPETANPVMDDPVDASPDEALKGGFKRACHLIIDDETMPAKDKLRRLKEIVMAGEKMISAGEEIPEAEDLETTAADKPELKGDAPADDDSDDDETPMLEGEDDDLVECDDEEMKSMKESKDPKLVRKAEQIELARYRNEKTVRELCESEGYQPDPIDFDALCALRSEDKRMALIESRKAAAPRKVRTNTVAVTEGRKQMTATAPAPVEVSRVRTAEDFFSYLTTPTTNGHSN